MTTPNYGESLEFLRRLSTERWVLTAIEPDRKTIVTRTFHPGEDLAWVLSRVDSKD